MIPIRQPQNNLQPVNHSFLIDPNTIRIPRLNVNLMQNPKYKYIEISLVGKFIKAELNEHKSMFHDAEKEYFLC